MFDVVIFDEQGNKHELGNVKIGFVGQTKEISTHSTLPTSFEVLSDGYFSLGQDVSYYQSLSNNISQDLREMFLRGLRDVVYDKENYFSALGRGFLIRLFFVQLAHPL
jgi:hypothetical protein